MPENRTEIALDSRWPAFFPSPICIVTTGDGRQMALEKVVGASIVNRFPYIVALSFCREQLSDRHYARASFCDLLERTGVAAVQFIIPGKKLDRAMSTIADVPDSDTGVRIARTGLTTRLAISNSAPVFEDAYMVYESRLVEPSVDFEGRTLFEKPWSDVGSHRIYYFKISTIQLQEDIARGASQIKWRSLPAFTPEQSIGSEPELPARQSGLHQAIHPQLFIPRGTIAFTSDCVRDGMAIKVVKDTLITDNDDARWPCFFPQSAGIITSRSRDGVENVMPCGSTTIVSRHPLVVAPCISYAAVNERYAPRASLDLILDSGWFGCGVPFIDDTVVDAIRYSGNMSLRDDAEKIVNCGLQMAPGIVFQFSPICPCFTNAESRVTNGWEPTSSSSARSSESVHEQTSLRRTHLNGARGPTSLQ